MMKKLTRSPWNNSRDVISVYQPNEIEITFDKLIGLENAKEDLKDVIAYIKNPSAFEKMGIRPHMHYLIQGVSGIGKTSLAFAVAHEANIPIVVVDCKDFINTRKKAFTLLKNAFKATAPFEYSVLLFKCFSRFFQINDDFRYVFMHELLSLMKKCEKVVVISTLDIALNIINGDYLFDEDAFSKTIDVMEPDLKAREEMYKLFCENIPVDSSVSFNRLAIDSLGMTAKDIKSIVKNAALLSHRNGEEMITRDYFDEVISQELLGQKRKKMTDKDRLSTAYHEAGHVIAGYFSNPEYKLSKVEIVHRSNTLGITMPQSDEDKLTYFKTDMEYRIIHSLGGICAERIIYNENTTGVSEDLSTATSYAKMMVCAFGMSDTFGIYSVYEACLDDEDDSSILKTACDSTYEEVNTCTKKILDDLYDKAFQIVLSHKKELEALTKALIEKESVDGAEIKEIFEKCKNDD